MKKIFQLSIIICFSLFFESCYYDAHPAYEDIDTGGETEVPSVISYGTNIQPLFAKCVGCHGGNADPDLRVGKSYNALVPSYVNASNSSTSKLYNYLPGNGHHEVGFKLKSSEIALIKAWIDQGAKNN